jgi:hypothetical protein
VVKRGRLLRKGGGGGGGKEVAVKMWPSADVAMAQRLFSHELNVYKVAAGCQRTCVLHGATTVRGRGALVLGYHGVFFFFGCQQTCVLHGASTVRGRRESPRLSWYVLCVVFVLGSE